MQKIISYKRLKLTVLGILKYLVRNKIFILLVGFFIFSSSFGAKETIFFITDKLQQASVKITKPIDIIIYNIRTLHKKYDFQKQEEELLHYKFLVQSLEDSNNFLRKQLNFANLIKGNFISARLLQINKRFGDETAVISCGANHKVRVGDVVFTSVGLFGRVKEVFSNYSKVILITNYDSRISFISNIHKERGIVFGYENKLRFKYLEENHSLEEGEVLLTSGESDVIPYGIPIGVVKKNQNNFFAEAYIAKHNIELVYVYIR